MKGSADARPAPSGAAARRSAKDSRYLLAPDHPQGGAKARFFQAFGFHRDDWQRLADALLRHAQERELHGERDSPAGIKYELRCAVETPDGRNPCIASIWIVEAGQAPRFITAYPSV